jgi:hypothetical protein
VSASHVEQQGSAAGSDKEKAFAGTIHTAFLIPRRLLFEPFKAQPVFTEPA